MRGGGGEIIWLSDFERLQHCTAHTRVYIGMRARLKYVSEWARAVIVVYAASLIAKLVKNYENPSFFLFLFPRWELAGFLMNLLYSAAPTAADLDLSL